MPAPRSNSGNAPQAGLGPWVARAADLRFTLEEARGLFAAAGVELTEPTLALLYERTEG